MVDSIAQTVDPTNCKVGRLLEKYGLEEVGGEMARKWNGNAKERVSLRSLADQFNQVLLECALEESDQLVLEGEVETLYRLLTDEETSPGDRTQARRRLQRAGIDVEELESEFVSYQAIRTYLTKYCNISYDKPTLNPDDAVNSVRRLQTRLEQVTASKADRLDDTGKIDIGSMRVSAEVQLFCEDCENRYTLADIVRNRGCDCKDL